MSTVTPKFNKGDRVIKNDGEECVVIKRYPDIEGWIYRLRNQDSGELFFENESNLSQ
jgi:hypothetical protein